MNRVATIFFTFLFLWQASSPIAVARQSDYLSDQVDTLFAEMNRPDRPGAAVLVIGDGLVLHRKGYGSANLEYQIPITPESVFDIASVSKQFTGMSISILIEDGIVSLDDDVRDYIPELPDFGKPVTVRHLVHHISGVRDWPGTLAIAGWQMDDVISFDQIMSMAYHQQTLNFDPGERYLYSNTGYNLLAEIVTRVTGKTFREWTHENLFDPLEMNDTHFQDDHTEMIPRKVSGYRLSNGSSVAVTNGLTAFGSSSLFTTIDDLGKWVKNFDDHAIGGTSVIERMRIPGVLNSGDSVSYAYGLSTGQYRGHRTSSHGGSWAGFRTFLLHFPEQRFGIIILANFASFNPANYAYQIADIYLKDVLTTTEEMGDVEPGADGAKPIESATLDTYVGTYKLGPGWFVEITREGEQLMTQATRESRFPMVARSQEEFYVPAYNAGMTFRRNANGQVTHFDYRNISAKRVIAWNPSDEELRTLEGQYYSSELATSYLVQFRRGTLIVKHRRHQEIELIPLAYNEFGGSLWFASGVEFVQDNGGNVSAMLISNGRSLDNEFTKIDR